MDWQLENGDNWNSTVNLAAVDPFWLSFDPTPLWVHRGIGGLVAVITIAAVLFNTLVILVYLRSPKLNKQFRHFVISMALSDALSAGITNWMMVTSCYHGFWIQGQLGCSLYGFTQGLCAFVSIMTIAMISRQRSVAVCWPALVRQRASLTRGRSTKLAALVWLLAVPPVLPPLLGWSRYSPEGLLTTCCFDVVGRDWLTRSFFIYIFVIGFFAPVGVILYSYGRVIAKVLRGLKARGRATSSLVHGQPVTNQSELKPLVLIGVIIGAFLVAWSPYAILTLLIQFGPRHLVTPLVMTAASLLAKSSTCYNPIIYAMRDPPFCRRLVECFGFARRHEAICG